MKIISIFAALSVLAASTYAEAPADKQAPQTQAPVFRSGATLVPLDVRVLDRSGQPITDLRQNEFVITEDGRPQSVSHFLGDGTDPDESR